jgi:hypothetical protein
MRYSELVPGLDPLRPILKRLTEGREPGNQLLVGPKGGVLTSATVRDATNWDQLVAKLELPDLTRHGLRHTGATWMADAGVPLHVPWSGPSVSTPPQRAHQHAAGARNKGLPRRVDREPHGRRRGPRPIRGGLTCKLHLAVDGRGPPMAIRFTAGQAGDNPQLPPPLDEVAVARPGRGGRGAARTR